MMSTGKRRHCHNAKHISANDLPEDGTGANFRCYYRAQTRSLCVHVYSRQAQWQLCTLITLPLPGIPIVDFCDPISSPRFKSTNTHIHAYTNNTNLDVNKRRSRGKKGAIIVCRRARRVSDRAPTSFSFYPHTHAHTYTHTHTHDIHAYSVLDSSGKQPAAQVKKKVRASARNITPCHHAVRGPTLKAVEYLYSDRENM